MNVLNTSQRPGLSLLVLVLMSNVLDMVGIKQNIEREGMHFS